MLPIYLCDDQAHHLNSISRAVQLILDQENFQMTLALKTSNPEELLAQLTNNQQTSVYFLDVDLQHPQYDGFSLGKAIRALDPDGYLIYITTHEELVFETFRYRLGALDYILKDQPAELVSRIASCLASIQALQLAAQTTNPETFYTVKLMDELIQLPINDILFFETSPLKHRVIVHTTQRQIEFYGQLQDISDSLADLTDSFMRTHRSYLVNMSKVTEFQGSRLTLTLVTGKECLISRKMKKTIKTLLQPST